METEKPIGVFDSGIGGLTVAAEIAKELPNEQIYYFGDTARCPYGDRHPDEVLQYSTEVLDFLYEQGVKMLVVACNTATAVALPTLEKRYDIPVLGVIQPGARAATYHTGHGKIGVIGTGVTIATGAYEVAVKAIDTHAEVVSLACPEFVPLVERGLWNGPEVTEVVGQSLASLVSQSVDTLILGCTHYPMLQAAIQDTMGAKVRLISSAQETAREVQVALAARRQLRLTSPDEPNRYFTSGDGTKLREALVQWFDISLAAADIQCVDVRLSSVSARFAK